MLISRQQYFEDVYVGIFVVFKIRKDDFLNGLCVEYVHMTFIVAFLLIDIFYLLQHVELLITV